MSKFSDRLEELINDNKLHKKTLAQKTGINATCISHYVLDKRKPTIKSLLILAEYFNCSTDFLLGLEEENYNLIFKKCPPFSKQLRILKDKLNFEPSSIYTNTKIAKSSYYDWLAGKIPTVENVVNLAELLDRRVDFVLGRES